MTFKKSISILYFLATTCQIGHALIPIEPPVKSEKTVKRATHTTFNYKNKTSLESDLRWRNISLQDEQPGMANYSQATMDYFNLKSYVDLNLYTNSSDTSKESRSVTLTHLMAETKIGAQHPFGTLRCKPIFWGIAKAIYMWPGGQNYQWNITKGRIRESSNIKSIKSTELTMKWNDYSLLYAIADQSTKTVVNNIEQGKNWGNYFEIATPKTTLQNLYTYGFKLTYWENVSKGIEANLSYRFSEKIHGILNLHMIKGEQDNEDDTGANAGIQFLYKTQTKSRQAR